MRKITTALVVGLVISTGAWADIKVTLKAPQLTSVTMLNGAYTLSASELSSFQTSLNTAVGTLQDELNTSSFGKFTLSELGKGFANANAATFDAATLLAYQNYDLFAVMVGTNIGLAAPSLSADALNTVADDILSKGDVYFGLGQSGGAVQAGLNTSWLIPNTRIYGKLGVVPTLNITADESTISTSGFSFGLGATYTIFPKFDLLAGLINWRGLVVGSGFVYGTSNVDLTVPVKSPDPQNLTIPTAQGNIAAQVSVDKVKAKLGLSNNYLIVPIEASTSLQALWFFNVGLGVGLDLALVNNAAIKVGTDANLGLTTSAGSTTINSTPGSASVSGDAAKGNGDFFMPRIGANVGFNIAILRIDVPLAYYPLSKAAAVGINLGLVW